MPGVFRVLLTLLWLPLASPAVAAPAAGPIFQPFDAASLTAPETRLVQTALAAAGDYRGALDGVWGGLSQGALDAYAERTFQDAALNVHAAALVLAFLDEVPRTAGTTGSIRSSGWRWRCRRRRSGRSSPRRAGAAGGRAPAR